MKSNNIGSALIKVIGLSILGVVAYFLYIQVNTKNDVQECTFLMSSKNINEIKEFIERVEKEEKKTKESDAIVTSVAIIAGEKSQIPTGMGVALRACLPTLKNHLKSLENKEKL